MKNKIFLVTMVMLVIGLILSACGSSGNNPVGDPQVDVSDPLPPVAVIKARQMLADTLGIGVENVEILSYEPAEWSDSCLGLGGAAESCLMVMVPGWKVELSAEGSSYIARTDELGDAIRFEQ